MEAHTGYTKWQNRKSLSDKEREMMEYLKEFYMGEGDDFHGTIYVEDTEKDGTGGSKGRTSPDHMTPRGGGSSTIKKIKEVLLLRQTKGGKNEVIKFFHEGKYMSAREEVTLELVTDANHVPSAGTFTPAVAKSNGDLELKTVDCDPRYVVLVPGENPSLKSLSFYIVTDHELALYFPHTEGPKTYNYYLEPNGENNEVVVKRVDVTGLSDEQLERISDEHTHFSHIYINPGVMVSEETSDSTSPPTLRPVTPTVPHRSGHSEISSLDNDSGIHVQINGMGKDHTDGPASPIHRSSSPKTSRSPSASPKGSPQASPKPSPSHSPWRLKASPLSTGKEKSASTGSISSVRLEAHSSNSGLRDSGIELNKK